MVVISNENVRQLLLDFGSETTHDARVEKHLFAKALAKSPGVQQKLSADAFEMLQVYANKGPYMTLTEERVEVGTTNS